VGEGASRTARDGFRPSAHAPGPGPSKCVKPISVMDPPPPPLFQALSIISLSSPSAPDATKIGKSKCDLQRRSTKVCMYRYSLEWAGINWSQFAPERSQLIPWLVPETYWAVPQQRAQTGCLMLMHHISEADANVKSATEKL
jgi:hypothetical protein